MTHHARPMLFPDLVSPGFDDLRTPQDKWQWLYGKLNVFVRHGGVLRTDVEAYQKTHGYDENVPGFQDNCYACGLGVMVTGDLPLYPGIMKKLYDRNKDQILYGDNKDRIIPSFDRQNARNFDATFQQALQDDDVLLNVPVDRVPHVFPVIAFTYTGYLGRADCHIDVPHLKTADGEGSPTFSFSCRDGYQKAIRRFADEKQFQLHHLGASCRRADVYFVPNTYLGQKAHIVDAEFARKQRLRNG